jgi:hypothetical protein
MAGIELAEKPLKPKPLGTSRSRPLRGKPLIMVLRSQLNHMLYSDQHSHHSIFDIAAYQRSNRSNLTSPRNLTSVIFGIENHHLRTTDPPTLG